MGSGAEYFYTFWALVAIHRPQFNFRHNYPGSTCQWSGRSWPQSRQCTEHS